MINYDINELMNSFEYSDSYMRKFLYFFMFNENKYISGTMCPAPAKITIDNKGNTNLDLESLKEGLLLMIDNHQYDSCKKVILQPKYMGSRLQIYINKNEDGTITYKATSRSGNKVKDNDKILEACENWYKQYGKNLDFNKSIIIDSELLPWAALGSDLIKNDFEAYSICARYELNMLKNDYFFNTYEVAKDFKINEKLSKLNKFDNELTKYTKDTIFEIKAFNILLIDEKLPLLDTETIFKKINSDEYLVLDLEKDENYYEKALNYFNQSIDSNLEGIVIKPFENIENKYLPYLKVRNKNYLRLIYGYDYDDFLKLKILCENKKISKKLSKSKKEYDLGLRMLKCNNPYDMAKLVLRFVKEDNNMIDPRL